eukprot:CAMPEP_0114592758 /NCGR_PEP_ID=MMETSP0125-20121206/14505_1 /TAXON_ID=485358 ORGANISM="Aristerostoma sp., Strain ATCC 50986" /NCGR_SAMPLE_ID=MMETSP0125 /ASSEMBLY_ACC=CAM_ASM_000245 /LENGTH=112 /DNA_ID=CAMNT_0001791563 /DNA_START=796 /DNA_END=1133 /DNA_ORIENTATION=-
MMQVTSAIPSTDHAANLVFGASGPVSPAKPSEFKIKNKSGDPTGTCTKKTKGCIQSALGDADNFHMEFPPRADERMKCILMCAIIFMDFRFFEENPNNNKNKGGTVIVAGDD